MERISYSSLKFAFLLILLLDASVPSFSSLRGSNIIDMVTKPQQNCYPEGHACGTFSYDCCPPYVCLEVGRQGITPIRECTTWG